MNPDTGYVYLFLFPVGTRWESDAKEPAHLARGIAGKIRVPLSPADFTLPTTRMTYTSNNLQGWMRIAQ